MKTRTDNFVLNSPSNAPLARKHIVKYVLITPAHNEAAFIEKTLQSVISQSILPMQWIIVNDASTDGTEEVIRRYSSQHDFITLVNHKRRGDRDFGGKVRAFNQGLTMLQDLDYQFIGNVDADVSFDESYFKNILGKFQSNQRLGIGGGIIYTKIENKFVTHDETLDSVGGAVQLFRRECFESVGGYIPLQNGGIDAAAEITAKMKGWEVRKFPEYPVYEHRRTGTASARPLTAKIREGRRFYSLGYGTLFYVLRCVYRMTDRPVILGSLAALLGFFQSMIRRTPVVLSPEAVSFLRSEQRKKLKRGLRLCI